MRLQILGLLHKSHMAVDFQEGGRPPFFIETHVYVSLMSSLLLLRLERIRALAEHFNLHCIIGLKGIINLLCLTCPEGTGRCWRPQMLVVPNYITNYRITWAIHSHLLVQIDIFVHS